MFDRQKKYITGMLFSVGGMFPAGLMAVENTPYDSDSISHYELHAVEVDAAVPVYEIIPAPKIDGIMLQTLPSQSVADAVRYFSGVQIKDYGGIGGLKTVNIRSMGSQHTGIFYDGLPIGNAQNGQIDLGRYSIDNLECVELFHGQKDSGLQSARDYASAASIYLKSKRPRFPNGENCHLSFGWKGGSFALLNPSLAYQQKITEKLYANLSGEYLFSNGRYAFRHRKLNPDGSLAYDTAAIRENGDIRAFRTEAALYGFLPQGDWKVQFYNYHSARGLPGYVARNLYSHSQRQWDNNFFVQGSLHENFSDIWSLQALAKYANDYTRYLNPDTTLQYIDNSYRQQEIYTSVAALCQIKEWWQASLATDWQWNSLDCDMKNFAFPERNTLLVAASTAIRLEKFKMQASALGTFVWDRTNDNGQRYRRHRITPSVSLDFLPADWFSVHAFYKKIFRMPTFNDLYYTLMGRADLQPELATQYDAGIVLKRGPFRIDMDGYYNLVEDKIVSVPTSNPFRWQMMNLGIVKIFGADVSARGDFDFRKDWSLMVLLNYTFQRARDFTDPDESYYGDQIPYIPLHSGTASCNLRYGKWNLHYSFIYTGERYDQSANIPANHVEPWYTHDMALSRWFPIQNRRLTLSGEVNNIFNQQYDVVLNYPMPGTSFRLCLKFEI